MEVGLVEFCLVLAPVAVVRCVAVAVVDVVDVIAMRHRFVPAARTVLVIVIFVDHVLGWHALVPVAIVFAMGVAVVDVVDVIAVGDRFVSTVGAVGMGVILSLIHI